MPVPAKCSCFDSNSTLALTPTQHQPAHPRPCLTARHIIHIMELTEEQAQLVRELRLLDADPPYRGLVAEQPAAAADAEAGEVQVGREVEYDWEHGQARERLLRWRRRSEQVYRVGELVREYGGKFGQLLEERAALVGLIEKMKGATAELVDRQRRLIDLSIKMKQSLDYYAYHDKLVFDFPCEVAARELFENALQPLLSELTDGLQFFQENSTYVQSKRQIGLFQGSRSKVLSFTKSFFIKLFNREQAFVLKNCKHPLSAQVDSLYPKARARLVSLFLLHFPQFHPRLQHILRAVKEGAPEEEARLLELKQAEIAEFELSSSNLALVGYLQRNMPEVYGEAILTFFTYYRLTLHQTLARLPHRKEAPFAVLFAERAAHVLHLLACELGYHIYCCRATLPDSAEAVRGSLTAIAKLHSDELVKLLRDPRNRAPFELCEAVGRLLEQVPAFLQDHQREEYQAYLLGAVGEWPREAEFLRGLLEGTLRRVLTEMEPTCASSLPRGGQGRSKREVEQQARAFLESLPRLRFCGRGAEEYVVGALDGLVRAIKETNVVMESRFECYLWNLEVFGNVRAELPQVRGSLVRRELKLDVNNSANLLERVRGVERNDSLLKYAQDVLQVLRAGMPVINELTLDFARFVADHTAALEAQFVKDILFIYSKNVIEFLHNLSLAPDAPAAAALAAPQQVHNLYSTYLLSLQKYVTDANALLADWRAHRVGPHTDQLIPQLLNEVYERLFDLLDRFYVTASRFVPTDNFKQIEALKNALRKDW